MNKYLLLKLISVLIASISQILLKKSANKTYNNKIKEYLNVLVTLGYTLFVISSLLSVISLQGITISYSSIVESLNYIIVPGMSYLLLKEKINKKQIIGMILIIIGLLIFNV